MVSSYSAAAEWLGNESRHSFTGDTSTLTDVESGKPLSLDQQEPEQMFPNQYYKTKDRSHGRTPAGRLWNTQQPKPKFVAHKVPKGSRQKGKRESNRLGNDLHFA